MRWLVAIGFGLGALGCAERVNTEIALDGEARALLADRSVKTALISLEQRSDSLHPGLRALWVLSDPSTLDDAALSAALPAFRYVDGELSGVTVIGYAETAEDLGIPASGELIAGVGVQHERAIPLGRSMYHRDVGSDAWTLIQALPPALAEAHPLPKLADCPSLAGRTIVPPIGEVEMLSITPVASGMLLAGIDYSTGLTQLYHLDPDGTFTRTATLPGRRLDTLAYDRSAVWAADYARLYRLSPDGRQLLATTQLGTGSLRVTHAADGRAIAYDGAQIWPLDAGTRTGTLAPSKPPQPFSRAALGPGSRMITLELDRIDATHQQIRVQITEDGTTWTEATPTRADDFDGSFENGYDVAATETHFFLIARIYAWIRAYGEESWRPVEVPAIGIQSGNLALNRFRHLRAMKGGRLVVGGEGGTIDLLSRAGPEVWCTASTGSFEWYDEIGVALDGSQIATFVNKDGSDTLKSILSIEVPRR
ncbi:MAG: hypothetical protein U1E65_28905 [Myxococcota bacterium]